MAKISEFFNSCLKTFLRPIKTISWNIKNQKKNFGLVTKPINLVGSGCLFVKHCVWMGKRCDLGR